MNRLLALSRRLVFSVAAIALAAGWTASSARADVAYAYAEQTITNLVAFQTDGEGTVTVIGITPQSSTFANLNGELDGHNTNTLDAQQAFVGPGLVPPAENTFVKYATFTSDPGIIPAGELPTAPPSSFSRGDVVLTAAVGPEAAGQVLAESYVIGFDQVASANGHNSIQYRVTVSETGTYDIVFDYSNNLYAVTNTPPGVDSASGSVGLQIRITGNGVNFFSAPEEVNVATGIAQPNEDEIQNAGTLTVTTPILTAGTQYFVTFQLDANTIVATAPTIVPEPATMAMALTALPLVGFGLVRRRNRKAQA